jgi:hypothetical protein
MRKKSIRALFLGLVCWTALGLLGPRISLAQTASSERTFPQSRTVVENALKGMQSELGGRLPVLDGFAQSPDGRALDRYRRGYFQTTATVTSTAKGSLVRITTKVTAWYEDPSGSHSGYQLLKSNGRLEADLLDQLQEQLAKDSPAPESTTVASNPVTRTPPAVSRQPNENAKPDHTITAPEPKFPDTDRTFSSSLKHGLASETQPKSAPETKPAVNSALQTEIESLQEVLKNTAHPKNLVAVKKSGTPVVGKPTLTAKPEFLASQHDEFEMLDFNADWVHVRISGLSRGWIWRNSVEMPEGIPDTATHAASNLPAAADLFQVSRQEVAPFPGDWAPLRSKNVKIISVQKVEENAKSGPQERLEFTKYLLEKSFPEVARNPGGLDGVVVIFDSADGGMVAATTATLQDWKAGKLSDAALWHNCFFDPPETFDSSTSSTGGSGAAAER